MKPAKYPMYARRYAGFTDMLLLESDDTGEWVPIDLTGYAARMQVRKEPHSDAELLATLDSDAGSIVIDDEEGTITLTLPDTLTGLIPEGRWAYDLRLVPPVGDAEYLIEGPFIMEGSVTTP